uniref:Uncharacterized protein n=1 Tax=Leptocylindrus danicus TaxID=163516 RepID=A0A7S2K9Y9_9STRA|mmetsp:Transcript_20319/g.30310  ORF Transcript_20319/g.30310 Transcript_20319/m.30310 type:complete len:326 (+) Transcript_20319:126-1103(+)|eukprot:CAMPEP_0116029076 /NCGR_PEP_ID=MMETSP0321-20121206/15881_1 /TAXON_ID=163516 /ORGANISM="Leptocylindrus danicus var. danicus, Strain B650" /LENGTH=325 /DNA_ID=CAMNT_0003503297 /DNA_START=140 /DNA_END=1117 /DNA_ORIENTATION=-
MDLLSKSLNKAREDRTLEAFTSMCSSKCSNISMDLPQIEAPGLSLRDYLHSEKFQVVEDNSIRNRRLGDLEEASSCVAFPCLKLKTGEEHEVTKCPQFLGGASCILNDEQAVRSWELGRRLMFRHNDITHAPIGMLRNICESFVFVLTSRLRSYVKLLLRKAMKKNPNSESVKHMLPFLNAETGEGGSIATVGAASSNFQTVKQASKKFGFGMSGVGMTSKRPSSPPCSYKRSLELNADRECVLSLPIKFSCSLSVLVSGTSSDVSLRTNGKIVGTFKRNTMLIKSVELSLDTSALYKCMKEQAIVVIRKALLTKSRPSDGMHQV